MKKYKMECMLFGIFAGIGAVFLIVGIAFMIHNIHFRSIAVPVTGTITEIEEYRDPDGDLCHRAYADYTFEGQNFENVPIGYFTGMHEGMEIELYCDPGRPSRAEYSTGSWLMIIIFSCFGIVFLLVGGIPILMLFKKEATNKKLQENGRALYAQVDRIELNYSYSVNNRHPFRIFCHYIDPYSNQVYQFVSDNIWEDPNLYIQPGADIQVLVMGGDYKTYHVNVERVMEGY